MYHTHPGASRPSHRPAKAAVAVLVLAASLSAHSQSREATPPSGTPGLSRAEVIADLALWRRAGADRYATLALSYGMEVPAYQAALQEYQRLRNSEQFQVEVRKALDD
ncbi:hypothetical protein Acav_4362 [Paracidovorax avenae ATCC 19860]|uniref:DUF4148 domain-containing protein n=1 Tax=Paracidovorax avenae (strain ATCC 19860 / DSM 7227 / CCUG 15838 / JCM 20985 / LMG 2117 / NCPPB 1011) TaxID=643561 RepID=F0Q7R3_PARA1|nr:DUF4148 domain-containing protein [Paracidovorax avenae]ADX48245.1 hypothetical protein Acav_4362 [Paracidovorax avenae ATCC 19860]